ncbi:hypothetical protein EST38_g10858 [Candolleomyces aberdarensis]|uniref:Uncharacterized protein n=1 Tax=Candolleomyces aberdarensis TaxID=2316362 RepID=A0A4Q2D8R3_9AGAR|nr:hypothetical protein EST38_g10858 [Candolleomyces aberdarensis]
MQLAIPPSIIITLSSVDILDLKELGSSTSMAPSLRLLVVNALTHSGNRPFLVD